MVSHGTCLVRTLFALCALSLWAGPAEGQTVSRLLVHGMTSDEPGLLDDPIAPAVDSAGNVWVAGSSSDNLLRVAPNGTVDEMLGPAGADGHPLRSPSLLHVDALDRVWVLSDEDDTVFRVDPDGSVTLALSATGVGGQPLDGPSTCVSDAAGNVFIGGRLSDNVFRVAVDGSVELVLDATGDGGAHPLDEPSHLVVDGAGRLDVLGRSSRTVLRVLQDGTVLGLVASLAGPLGNETAWPKDLEILPGGDVQVVRSGSPWSGPSQVLEITSTHSVDVVSEIPPGPERALDIVVDGAGRPRLLTVKQFGSGHVGSTFEYALDALTVPALGDMQGDTSGRVFGLVDDRRRLVQAGVAIPVVDAEPPDAVKGYPLQGTLAYTLTPDGTALVAGSARLGGQGDVEHIGSDNVLAVAPDGSIEQIVSRKGVQSTEPTVLSMKRPGAVAVDGDGGLFVVGSASRNVLRRAPDGRLSEIGQLLGPPGLEEPSALALDAAGNVFVADRDIVSRIDSTGTTTVVMGPDGLGPFLGLAPPVDLAVTGDGTLFVGGRNRLFRVTPDGDQDLVLPSGQPNGPQIRGQLSLALDAEDRLFVACSESFNIVRVDGTGEVVEVHADLSSFGPPVDIAIGPDGAAVVAAGQQVLRSTNGALDAIQSGPATCHRVAVDDAGNVYGLYAQPFSTPVRILRTTPAGRVFDALGGQDTLDGQYHLGGVTVDRDGQLIFASPRVDTVYAVAPGSVWANLGGASVGSHGTPRLTAHGSLTPGSTMDRFLVDAAPDELCAAFISLTSTPWEVLGGTLHAHPAAHQILFETDSRGRSALTVEWPPGFASGVEITLQFVIRDPGVAAGMTLSNAVRQITP